MGELKKYNYRNAECCANCKYVNYGCEGFGVRDASDPDCMYPDQGVVDIELSKVCDRFEKRD
jgi:hypothetical protein